MNEKCRLILVSGWATQDTIWHPLLATLNLKNPVHFVSWNDYITGKGDYIIHDLVRTSNTPYCFIGWSLGGLIGLNYTSKYPTSFKRMILLSTTARMVQDTEYTGVDPKVLKAMLLKLKKDRTNVLESFFKLCLNSQASDSLIKELLIKAETFDTNELSQGLDFLYKTDLRGVLDKIKIPSLIIHGKKDQVIPYENAQYLMNHLVNGTLHTIDDAGHALHIENNNPLLSTIQSFLSYETTIK